MINIIHYQRNANQNHFMPARMAAIQKSTSNKCWRGCGEKEISLTSSAGKTGQPLVKKNETRTFSNVIHKNKLKID